MGKGIRRRRLGRLVPDSSGQALAEFALLVPVLFLMICGIIDFGRLLYIYMNMNMTAQEAVRLGGLGEGDVTITEFAKDHFTAGNAEELVVGITPAEADRESGEYVTVTLASPFHPVTPVLPRLLPDDFNVMTHSTIRVE